MVFKKGIEVDMVPKHLIEDIASSRCVLFIGAGVSRQVGLPSGDELAVELWNYGIDGIDGIGTLVDGIWNCWNCWNCGIGTLVAFVAIPSVATKTVMELGRWLHLLQYLL
ncbi:MAG: hypothetical protein QMD08_04730 [Actinomycetota bacterium]|nr:hypothetical protein [Actinomycetota bacterium]